MLPPDPDLTSTPLSSWPLPAHAQKALICGLFQRPSTSSLGTLTVSRYLEYYRSQCTRFSSLAAAAAVAQTSRPRSSIASSARPLTAESELSKTSSRPSVLGGEPQKEQQLAALTHADLVAVAAMLMEGMSRQEVAEQMRSRQLQGGDSRSAGGLLAGGPATAVNAKAVERTIDLVVSLLIMVEVGAHDLMGRHGGPSGAPLYWASAGSLADFVCGQLFALPEKPLELGGMRAGIEKGFNARSLMRVGGMTVKWTTNLADHLRLADDDKTVFVFHFAGFLQLQRR